MCFVETNVPWHKNDFHYDISVANKNIWDTPTKTVVASCRSEIKGSKHYLPGGGMTVAANSLTTKIQSTSSDYLGRWAKVRFFAKKGALAVYSVYRPNPSSLSTACVNSSWMQQYRFLSKSDKTVDPRQQLISDLIKDVNLEQNMNSKMIILGDFNEDISDNETSGIKDLMEKNRTSTNFPRIENNNSKYQRK